MNGRSGLFSMKLKLIVGLLTTVAAAVVVCIVSFNHPIKAGPNENGVSHKRSLELQQESDSFTTSDSESVHRQRRQSSLVRGGTSSRNEHRSDIDCTSFANNTIPAAHIKARGRFAKPTGSTLVPGYQQEWICSDIDPKHPHHPVHAFVDGGMKFRHKKNRIYVPTCGYYHISSQILFEFNSQNKNRHAEVSHLLKFLRNCYSEDNANLVMGVSSILPGNTTTTFASDVVKLCEGGSVWVEIHETHDDDVYPLGDSHATFITAVLVAETSCHWPPTTMMENSDHSHD